MPLIIRIEIHQHKTLLLCILFYINQMRNYFISIGGIFRNVMQCSACQNKLCSQFCKTSICIKLIIVINESYFFKSGKNVLIALLALVSPKSFLF